MPNAVKDISLYKLILNYMHVKEVDSGLEEIRLFGSLNGILKELQYSKANEA